MLPVEQLPRIFQANVGRLFVRVIVPVMENLPVHAQLVTGIASSMDEFLDRCAAQVDNHTANEADKVYALVLIALFERQFRLWADLVLDKSAGIDTTRDPFLKVFDAATAKAAIALGPTGIRDVIEEAFEVGNVVRHGEGRALARLQQLAPHLIDRTMRDYIDLLPPDSPDSEWLRIRPTDVERYANAIIHFWGLADRQPGAVLAMTLQAPAL
jgi:hypothetical protein